MIGSKKHGPVVSDEAQHVGIEFARNVLTAVLRAQTWLCLSTMVNRQKHVGGALEILVFTSSAVFLPLKIGRPLITCTLLVVKQQSYHYRVTGFVPVQM